MLWVGKDVLIMAQSWLMVSQKTEKVVICNLSSKSTFYKLQHFKIALIFDLKYWPNYLENYVLGYTFVVLKAILNINTSISESVL